MAEAEAAPMELDSNQAESPTAEVQDAPDAEEQPKEQQEQTKGKKQKQEQAKHDAEEDKDESSPEQKKKPLFEVTVVEGKRERKKVRDCARLLLRAVQMQRKI